MNTKVLYTFISASFLILIFQVAFSAPPVSFYNPGETNDPSCAPNDINCDVSLDSLDTDDQTLSLSGSNLSIQDGNTITLPSVTDTDDQILSLSGGILSIQDGNNVDLAAFDSDTIYTANGTVGSNRTVGVTDILNFDSNTFVIDGADNRVGIGTSNPLSQLDVISSSPTTEDAVTVRTNANNADILMKAQGSIAAESSMYINIDSDDNATSNALFIGHNAKGNGAAALMTVLESGNVGIGIGAPLTKIHSSVSSGNNTFRLQSGLQSFDISATGVDTFLTNNFSGGDNLYTVTGTGGAHQFWTQGTAKVSIIDNGNVGIGTANPTAKLHLDNLFDAKLTSTNHGITIGSDTSTNLVIDNNEILARNNGSGATNLFLQLEDNGKVGIGDNTIYPAKLNVDVDISDGELFPPLFVSGDNLYGDITTGSGEALSLGHWDDPSQSFENRLHINFLGNIGIGTDTPGSKLSVVGLPSGTTDSVTPGSLAGAVCITTSGNMYIDTDGTCSN